MLICEFLFCCVNNELTFVHLRVLYEKNYAFLITKHEKENRVSKGSVSNHSDIRNCDIATLYFHPYHPFFSFIHICVSLHFLNNNNKPYKYISFSLFTSTVLKLKRRLSSEICSSIYFDFYLYLLYIHIIIFLFDQSVVNKFIGRH